MKDGDFEVLFNTDALLANANYYMIELFATKADGNAAASPAYSNSQSNSNNKHIKRFSVAK